ncbi:hypothetical protein FCG40_10220 [Fimbriimonadia bacterium ATM]|nr:MAG: hypothetical protein EDM73_11045 [Armatimonadota bacterium]MBC6970176.1 hypothetical protein [Armatimonadota bacterium]MCE7900579.1 hypothetical protein [Armatimonadetes bacterium ATM1]MDL1929352.1 hypothetical protein [Fimbriimonadia bacterium ATM]RIJ97125.1 MAG: hypothetical protein DCC45_03550 [Armatimonadota bacterium]
MSITRRAYDLLRAYVGREWERIESVFERDARKELDDYLKAGKPTDTVPPPPPPSPARHRTPAEQAKEESRIERAYKVLNLSPGASLQDLKRAYKRLSERSLPTNFPEGTEERRKAAEVHLKVQEAYDTLLPLLDQRLRRFQSLDLD